MSKPIAEFIGLPGSGKTTVARELLKELKKHQVPISGNASLHLQKKSQRLLRKLQIVLYSSLHPFKTFRYWKICRALPSLREQLRLFLIVIAQNADQKREMALIYDQGVINFLLTLYARDIIEIELINTLITNKDIPTPDILLEIHTEENIALNRVRARRNTHQIESLAENEAKIFMQKYQSAISKLQFSQIKHTQFSGQEDPTYIAKKIVKIVT